MINKLATETKKNKGFKPDPGSMEIAGVGGGELRFERSSKKAEDSRELILIQEKVGLYIVLLLLIIIFRMI